VSLQPNSVKSLHNIIFDAFSSERVARQMHHRWLGFRV